MKTIAVLVGSNRKQSINLKFARALGKLAQGKLDFRYADLGAMPMFNDDLVADLPQSVRAMKDLVAQADGVLLVTPEPQPAPSPRCSRAPSTGAPGPTARIPGTASPAPSSAPLPARSARWPRRFTCAR